MKTRNQDRFDHLHYVTLLPYPEDFLEGLSKVHVENGVNDRIETGVNVAKPGNKIDHFVTGLTSGAEWNNDILGREKGRLMSVIFISFIIANH